MKRKMSALQKKYFGKRTSKKGVGSMARRRSYRRVGAYVKRSYHARGGSRGIGGKIGGMLPPVIGGVADTLLSKISLPIIGKVPVGVGSALTGHFMGDVVTRNIGLYQLGATLPSMLGLGSGNTIGHVGQVGG